MSTEARLLRLERLCKGLAIALVLVVGMGAGVGYAKFKVVNTDIISAKNYQLVDESGELIGQWGLSPADGSCQFVMADISVAGGKPSRCIRFIVEKGFVQVLLEQEHQTTAAAITAEKKKAYVMTKQPLRGWETGIPAN